MTFVRNTCLWLLAFAVLALGATQARADEVTVAGTTDGCFSATCPGTNPLGGLTFTGTSFGQITTVGGFAAVSDLGTFSLDNTTYDYTGSTFTLDVTFTMPSNVSGSPTTFTAQLMGSVKNSPTLNGGVYIDFNNTTQYFTFNDGVNQGSFGFNVNDLSLNANSSNTISGNIVAASQTPVTSAPEPGSFALLAGGFLTVTGLFRRKRIA